MDGDEILREIVERKTRMQSYTPFNLDATVQVGYRTVGLLYIAYFFLLMQLAAPFTGAK